MDVDYQSIFLRCRCSTRTRRYDDVLRSTADPLLSDGMPTNSMFCIWRVSWLCLPPFSDYTAGWGHRIRWASLSSFYQRCWWERQTFPSTPYLKKRWSQVKLS